MEDNYDPYTKKPYSYLPGMPGYMEIRDVAEAMNINTLSITNYVREGRFPEPDKRIARTPLWKEETIFTYLDKRPTTLSQHFMTRMLVYGYTPTYKPPYGTKTAN